jgi:hypothetical protein
MGPTPGRGVMARVFLAEGTATVVEDEPDLGWDL